MSAANTVWHIDPSHSTVEFSVRHMVFATVRGRFRKVKGTIIGDPSNLCTARIEAEIDATSVDTAEQDRDQHLQSADFFEVEKFPRITFASRAVTRSGNDRFNITGDLTIRDVTKEVNLDATLQGQGIDPWGKQRIGLSAEGSLEREDFGLMWNALLETGGVLVSNNVKLHIQVQAVRQDEA